MSKIVFQILFWVWSRLTFLLDLIQTETIRNIKDLWFTLVSSITFFRTKLFFLDGCFIIFLNLIAFLIGGGIGETSSRLGGMPSQLGGSNYANTVWQNRARRSYGIFSRNRGQLRDLLWQCTGAKNMILARKWTLLTHWGQKSDFGPKVDNFDILRPNIWF